MKADRAVDTPTAVDRRRLILGTSGIGRRPGIARASVAANAPQVAPSADPVTHYRTKTIDGIKIFYREAGPEDAPGRAAAARLSDLVAHVPQPDAARSRTAIT